MLGEGTAPLAKLCSDRSARDAAVRAARRFAEAQHSPSATGRAWEAVFEDQPPRSARRTPLSQHSCHRHKEKRSTHTHTPRPHPCLPPGARGVTCSAVLGCTRPSSAGCSCGPCPTAPRAALKTLHSLPATDVGVLLHGVGPIRRAARRIARQAAAARARHEAASAVAAAGARHRKLLLVRRLSATAPAVRGAAGARRLAGGLGLDPPRHVAAEGDGRTAAPRARARLQLAQAQGGVTFVCALFFVVLWVVSTCHAHGARAPASALRARAPLHSHKG